MLTFIANEIRAAPLQATAAVIFLLGLVASAAGSLGGGHWNSFLGLGIPASPIALALLLGTAFGLMASLLFRIGSTVGAIASFAAVFAIIEATAWMSSANIVLGDTSGMLIASTCAFFPFFGLYMQSVNARLGAKSRLVAAILMLIVAAVAFPLLLPMRMAMYING